jgi:hypothetical protein
MHWFRADPSSVKLIPFGGIAWKGEYPALAMLFSYSSLGCEVLKTGKGVPRVDEPPDEWQCIEVIPLGEKAIQRKRHFICIFAYFG